MSPKVIRMSSLQPAININHIMCNTERMYLSLKKSDRVFEKVIEIHVLLFLNVILYLNWFST